jgi:hypothetical protein
MSEAATKDSPGAEAMQKQRDEAKERAEQCHREVQDVLAKYACRIQPMLTQEAVGNGPGMKVMLGATYGILPEVVE